MTVWPDRASDGRGNAVLVVGGVGLAVGISVAVMETPIGLILSFVGLVVLVFMFVRIEWALFALIFITYTNFSDIAIVFHGAPSVAKLSFALVIALVLLRWVLMGERPGGTLDSAIFVFALVLIMAFPMVNAINPTRATDNLLNNIKNAVLVVTITLVAVRGSTLRGVVWTLLVAGLFLSGISAVQYVTGDFYSKFGGFGRASIEQIVGGIDSWRLSGPLDDANYYGQLLVVLVPLALDRLYHERRLSLRIVAALALALCLGAILLTYSRGTLLALGGIGLAYVIALRRRPGLVAAVVALAIAVVALSPAKYLERAHEIIAAATGQGGALRSKDPAIRGRSGEMLVAWEMFLDHPLLGVGPANYTANFQQYNLRLHLQPRNEDRDPHDLYLQIAAERGILGLAAFAVLVGWLATSVIRARALFGKADLRDFAGIAGAIGIAWIGFAITEIFLDERYNRYFWLFVGITLALPQVAEYEWRRRQGGSGSEPTERLPSHHIVDARSLSR